MIEYVAILLAAVFGAAGAPVWMAAAVATLLAAPALARDREMIIGASGGRTGGALLMLAAASLLNAGLFSCAAYAIGYFIARLALGI